MHSNFLLKTFMETGFEVCVWNICTAIGVSVFTSQRYLQHRTNNCKLWRAGLKKNQRIFYTNSKSLGTAIFLKMILTRTKKNNIRYEGKKHKCERCVMKWQNATSCRKPAFCSGGSFGEYSPAKTSDSFTLPISFLLRKSARYSSRFNFTALRCIRLFVVNMSVSFFPAAFRLFWFTV